jgi:hypothetical protein
MFADLAEAVVWTIRILIFTGLTWGTWIVFSHTFLPARSEKRLEFEHFATFALLVLIFSTVGGVIHAG